MFRLVYLCLSNDITSQGPSIKYVTLFWTDFDPSPVTLCHTSRDPRFLVVAYMRTYIGLCLYRGFDLVREGFCSGSFVRGFLSGKFFSGWFLCVSLLS